MGKSLPNTHLVERKRLLGAHHRRCAAAAAEPPRLPECSASAATMVHKVVM